MTIAAIPATGSDPGPAPGLLDAELLISGETGRIDDIPADVWKQLTAPFEGDQIEKRPQVNCFKCTENRKNKRPELCDEHPRKVRCAGCGQFITPGHMHLDYVGHAGITMRLNEVLTPAGWNWRPMAFTTAGTPLLSDGGMWILLTIGGVTRIGFGDATGKPLTPSAIKEIIGDGIRNAGMRFGVATYLWSKSNAAEQLKNLPAEPEEDYATSLAVAADLGELYLAASRLKLAVEAGAVSEALAVLLRRSFAERRAVLDAEQQHSPTGPLPADHWDTPGSGTHPGSAAPVPAGTGEPNPSLKSVEPWPPRSRPGVEDYAEMLARVTSLEAVGRVEKLIEDSYRGTGINGTLFVDLAEAAAGRRAELGAPPVVNPVAAALAAILTRAATTTRKVEDIGQIHALIRQRVDSGALSPADGESLTAECRRLYTDISTAGHNPGR